MKKIVSMLLAVMMSLPAISGSPIYATDLLQNQIVQNIESSDQTDQSDLDQNTSVTSNADQDQVAAGPLVIYTTNQSDEINLIADAFLQRYPHIDLIIMPMSAKEAIDTLEKQESAPEADVMWGGTSYNLYAPNTKLWEPYKSYYLNQINADFLVEDGSYTNYSLYGMVFLESDSQLEALKVTADSYKDLLNEDFFGMIAMGNPETSIPAYNDLINILAANGGAQSDQAWDYAWQLCEIIDGLVVKSADQVTKEVAKDKYAVGFTSEKLAADAVEKQKQDVIKQDEQQAYKESTLKYQVYDGVEAWIADLKLLALSAMSNGPIYHDFGDGFIEGAKRIRNIVKNELVKTGITTRSALKKGALGSRTLQMVYPKEGGVWIPSSAAIVKNAPDMNNAKLFIDFLLTEQAQNLLSSINIRGTNTEIVPVNPLLKPWDELKILQAEDIGSNRKEDSRRWNDLLEKAAANDGEIKEDH